MATRDAEALDRTLAALADPTRRAMVERLAKSGRMAISDLATPFAMSLPAVLKHVGVLTEAGLVSRVKVGRTVYCHLLSGPIRTALTWLRKYENYQVPAESAAAPRATASSARRPGRPAAKSEARTKHPAPKAARKPASRPVGRPSQAKPKAAPGRTKAVAPASAATTGKRGAGTLTTTLRRRPGKVAAVRRRPRR